MQRDQKYGLTFISPAIFFFLLFWILPVLLAAYYSATDWVVGQSASFIALDNYVDLFTDPRFHQSLVATLKITVPALFGSCMLALLLAVILSDDELHGRRLILLIIMLPVVADWVATGLVWQLIFLPNGGVLASIFAGLGWREGVTLRWTSSRLLAPWAIAIFTIWKTTGLNTVIFLAGLKGIPEQYQEAAQVDGANDWQTFRHITFPLLRPITVFVLISAFVNIIGFFEPIFMLTGGGPADATRTLPLYLYETFFQFHKGGAASAAGIIFLLLCLVFAVGASNFLRYSYYE
jgi:ABC-type sugar transport system permease subunit